MSMSSTYPEAFEKLPNARCMGSDNFLGVYAYIVRGCLTINYSSFEGPALGRAGKHMCYKMHLEGKALHVLHHHELSVSAVLQTG